MSNQDNCSPLVAPAFDPSINSLTDVTRCVVPEPLSRWPQTFSAVMQLKSYGQAAPPDFRAGRINGTDDLDSLAVFLPIGTRQHEKLLSVQGIIMQNPL
jgi:hypothetical protein